MKFRNAFRNRVTGPELTTVHPGMEGVPDALCKETAISKSRIRLQFPFSHDWTIIKHTTKLQFRFVEKRMYILQPLDVDNELHILPLTHNNVTRTFH